MDIISLTGPEARVLAAAAPTSIDLTKAVDVRDYDSALYQIRLTAVIPGSGPSVTIAIWGGTQTDSTDGWVQLQNVSFPSIVAFGGQSSTLSSLAVGTLPNFVTWSITAMSNITEVGISISARANRRSSMLP